MFNCLLRGQDNNTGVHSVHMRDYRNQALLNEWVQRYFAKVQALMHYTLTPLSLHLTLAACADLCRGHRPLQLGCGRECVCVCRARGVCLTSKRVFHPAINQHQGATDQKMSF